MKNENNGKNNVIDMTERMQEPDQKARLKSLKVRFDLEQAKVGLSASLLSIVFLVTIANNGLLKSAAAPEVSQRGIASVPTGTSDAEDSLVRDLARRELGQNSIVGKKPTELESLAFGMLEGKYAVRLENGKLRELVFSNNSDTAPKHISDLAEFIDSNKALLPVQFEKSMKVSHVDHDGIASETYQLVDSVSRPVANVQFTLDVEGRMLGMKVSQGNQVASN
ncbi:MAG: hypothetical protein V4692_12730 [Bdellovibrionota bacterium]